MQQRQGPLAGIRVVDLSLTIMGPYCTQILADLGADVIKVESAAGDTTRYLPPFRDADRGGTFLNVNRGKRSIVLDLKSAAGRDALLRLVKTADVFVHSMRAQAIARLQLDYPALSAINPRLVYANLYGFGRQGPYADLPAYDDVIQAASGLAMLQARLYGGVPGYVATALADKVAGLTGVYAILAALLQRERSGWAAPGQEIEVPMFETIASFLLTEHMAGAIFDPAKGTPEYPRLVTPQRRPYRTADGYLAVLVYNDKQWTSFFRAIGNPPWSCDDRFTTMAGRAANIAELYELLATALADRGNDEWLALLRAADIPAMPVLSTGDLLDDPHLEAVGFWHRAEGDALRYPGIPTHFSTTPGAISGPAPGLGQHNREVLAELGYSEAEIEALAG
jgi:crotonobetainyl-CoA:carnitine CoA-transferase CaiB-like acyl-CoA transferase